MGMNTDIHVFDIDKLKHTLIDAVKNPKDGLMSPEELLDKVMPEMGIVLDNKYFIVQNEERWEDYSPWSQFLRLFEWYYQRTDLYELSEKAQVAWRYDGANAYEVLSGIGIDPDELPPHPYDEEDDE